MATIIGLLSLAQFKRADYLLPAYPGAALLLASPAGAFITGTIITVDGGRMVL